MTGRRSRPGAPWEAFGGGGFGPPPWAGGRGFRGPKARRGDVRAAILSVLADQPLNGYQVIQEIAERSGGSWKPSPGSVYPTLQQLEDEGLVTADSDAGRRAYRLTDEGRGYVADHPEEMAALWESRPEEASGDGLRPLVGQVAAAVWQLMAVGSPDQQARAQEALLEFRRRLYGILAEDSEEGRR